MLTFFQRAYETLGVAVKDSVSDIIQMHRMKITSLASVTGLNQALKDKLTQTLKDEFTPPLKIIARARGGQDRKDIEVYLHKLKATQMQQDPVDIAWNDLELEQKASLSDDAFIVALYRRINAHPDDEPRLRASLLTIADSLGNSRLRQVSNQCK